MPTRASPSLFPAFWAAWRRRWRRALQTLAARRAQAAHQRRMAQELMGMSEREMLDLAIGRGEMVRLLSAAPGPEAAPAAAPAPRPRRPSPALAERGG